MTGILGREKYKHLSKQWSGSVPTGQEGSTSLQPSLLPLPIPFPFLLILPSPLRPVCLGLPRPPPPHARAADTAREPKRENQCLAFGRAPTFGRPPAVRPHLSCLPSSRPLSRLHAHASAARAGIFIQVCCSSASPCSPSFTLGQSFPSLRTSSLPWEESLEK